MTSFYKYFNANNKSPNPQGNPYRRPESHVEYQVFSEDYFSAADVNIFFGNIWVDEAISLAFQLQEEVLPIFGYASYTFDTAVRGRRVISGSFAINFKQPDYLKLILQNALPINYTLTKAQQDGIIHASDFQKMKLDDILNQLGIESFEQMADEYEKAIWGMQEDTKQLLSNPQATYFPMDNYGFDIKINYGAVSEAIYHPTSLYFNPNTQLKPNISVETINGVQLNFMTKNGIGTDTQGLPITESYGFIARDLNGPLYNG